MKRILREYKKREFCKDMNCDVLSKVEKGELSCEYQCMFTAWHFHNWLQEKGFIIGKEKCDHLEIGVNLYKKKHGNWLQKYCKICGADAEGFGTDLEELDEEKNKGIVT